MLFLVSSVSLFAMRAVRVKSQSFNNGDCVFSVKQSVFFCIRPMSFDDGN